MKNAPPKKNKSMHACNGSLEKKEMEKKQTAERQRALENTRYPFTVRT